jgi:hypothetical protein
MRCITCGRVHEEREWPGITDQDREDWREGKFRFPVPPVDTREWDEDSWIVWSILHGER